MAKDISLLGANYPGVPAVELPQTGGGTATFYDIQVINSLDSDSTTDALSAAQGKALNTKIVGTNGANARNLSGYTAKTLIDECVTQGYKLYYCSASGGNKLSDLPITQAGVYIVRADTYYKSLDFMGTNGYDYHYDYTNNAWTSLNSKIDTHAIAQNTDLNNLTTVGDYECATNTISSSLTHCPVSVTFTMMVRKRGSYMQQVIFTFDGIMYIRNQGSSGWGDWKELALNDNATKYYYDQSSTTAGVLVKGSIAQISCLAGNWYNTGAEGTLRFGSTSGTEWVLPSNIRPIENVEILETGGKRIVVQSDGKVICAASLTGGAPLRFSATWIIDN